MIGHDDTVTTFADILQARSVENPCKTAFVFIRSHVDEAEYLDYATLYHRASGIATALSAHRLAEKNVLLCFPPGLDFVAALFGCFMAGVVAVPLPYTAGKRTHDRIREICRDAQPAAVLSIQGFSLSFLDPNLPGLIRINVDQLVIPSFAGRVAGSNDDLALLQYTSGSTSAPKGVKLTHGNLLVNNAMIARAFRHDEHLIGVGWLPLFHDMGLIGHVLQPVFVGGTSVIMSPLTFLQRPRRWLEAIAHFRATTSGGPSHGYALCLRDISLDLNSLDLSSWTVAYCGAEPIRASILRDFARKFEPAGFCGNAFTPCYGLAEATLLVSSRSPGEPLITAQPSLTSNAGFNRNAVVNCGRAWVQGAIVIRDLETGESCEDGTVGVVCVQGAHVGAGYWQRDELNRETFRTAKTLTTGDLGFLLDGELHIVGRLNDVVIVMGLKHAAEDIERSASASDPMFDRMGSAAFSVNGGEGEVAILIQEVSARASPSDHAAARGRALSAVTRDQGMRLADLVLVRAGTIPRTSSGKVQRSRCREMFLNDKFDRLDQRRELSF